MSFHHASIAPCFVAHHAITLTARVKSIIDPTESLTPGILYVGVATLTGSIVARNRFLLTRLVLPPTLFLLSAHHFLPKTTANLSAYFGSLEEKYFPTFAEKHDIAKAHSAMTWERMKEATQEGRQGAGRQVAGAVAWLEEVTGLKLRDAMGWSRAQTERATGKKPEELVEAAKSKVLEAVEVVKSTSTESKAAMKETTEQAEQAVGKKIEVASEKIEKKAEEVKRLV
jgi:MICOS complex subunit MIC26